MVAKKYVELGATGLQEKAATDSSAGAGNAGDLVALDTAGKIALNMLPTGVGPATKSMLASESMTAPCLVNIWDDAGSFKIRYADAATNKPANGFLLASVTSGASGAVYFEGEITGMTGITPVKYWLSATVPGGVQTTVPTTTGHIAQQVGVGLSSTSIDFEAQSPITRA